MSPPHNFACPICHCSVQREAHLTRCCGHHFCFQCIDPLRREGKNCPMCRKSPLEIFPNKERQRMINALQVHCSWGQESSGMICKWEGKLCQLAKHVAEIHGDTSYDGWLNSDQSLPTSKPSPKPSLTSSQPSEPCSVLEPVSQPSLPTLESSSASDPSSQPSLSFDFCQDPSPSFACANATLQYKERHT